ncbi:MAG: HAMP domain-containing protein, partial [Deltaproteobacteria bacterium]|nr:HAMP domain-containing protein [Deltaproteobacteria bacterium]
MVSNSNQTDGSKKRGNFKLLLSGLTGKLLLWFLLISLVPVTTVSLISYLNSKSSLIRAANDLLVTTARFEAEKVLSLSERWMIDAGMQARNKENIRLLKELKKAYDASGQSPEKFVESFSWLEIDDERGGDLRNFQTAYGYSDIFLIDSEGNVLFSSFGNDDLGTNLFSGKYSDTLFSRTAEKVLKTGISAFSDFEIYGPLNNQATGFVVKDMLDDEGNKIGLLAIGIHARQIASVMNELSHSGKKSAEVYLVGTDLKMRSNSIHAKEKTILKKRIDTVQTRAWRKYEKDKVAVDHQKKALVYMGPNGKKVLGVHYPIHIGEVPFGIIAEIEEQEAFAPAIELRAIVIVLLLATGVVVLFFAVFLSRRIARPILDLSKSADRVAGGRFDQEIQIKSRDEIGKLGKSFNNMVNNLRHMTEEGQRQNWLKSGAMQLNDVMSGEKRPAALSQGVISFLAGYLGAQVGAIYLMGNNSRLRMEGSYAFKKSKQSAPVFEAGEGLIGQAAVDEKPLLVTDVPKDYFTVNSGLGDAPPRNILLVPFLHEGE